MQRAIDRALKDEAKRCSLLKKDKAKEKKKEKGESRMMRKEENEQRRFVKWLQKLQCRH